MKRIIVLMLASLTVIVSCAICGGPVKAAEEIAAISAVEYATLHWDGRENTHVIYANGKLEFLGSKFKGIKRPERADERAFFMNLAMNALAREGYELVAMTPDDYVFRRTPKR